MIHKSLTLKSLSLAAAARHKLLTIRDLRKGRESLKNLTFFLRLLGLGVIVFIVLLTINFICALLVYIGENNDLQQYTS